MARPDLPTGTVTFLFTDVEGSTRLLREHGAGYADLLAEHRTALRGAFTRYDGVEVDTQGDAFFVAFARATDAVAAAAAAREAISGGPIRVRMGIHTGEPQLTDEGYIGIDVHRAARIAAAAHGGQIVISATTQRLLRSDAHVRDLGEHRLKDLVGAERLFQLGDGEFPPLRTLDATNLPIVSIPLVGREQELEELVALVSNGARLLTVTGPGGTGKTRVALQVAAELVGTLHDGVFWIPLGGLFDHELLPSEIARTVGAPEDLAGFLRGRELLILLDNFEHLLDAAPAVSALLASSSGLRVLATSRTPLRLSSEQEYRLEPLPDGDAATLFVQRARGRARAHGQRDRRRDLPPPRRAPVGDRARGRANEAARPRAAARAPRLRPPAPDRRNSRRPGASAHAASDDRMELRPPRCGRPSALRPPRRLRGHVPTRGRRGRRRCGPRRSPSPRRLEPGQADRRRPLPDARDDPRVRGREARRVEGRRRGPASACGVLHGACRGGVRAPLRRRGGVV